MSTSSAEVDVLHLQATILYAPSSPADEREFRTAIAAVAASFGADQRVGPARANVPRVLAEIDPSKTVLDHSTQVLRLRTATRDALDLNQIFTVRELLSRTEKQTLALPYIGPVRIEEIKKALMLLELELPE